MSSRWLIVAVAAVTLSGGAAVAWSAVETGTSTIATVAGTGERGDRQRADGVPATSLAVDHPRGLALLPGGGFLVAEPFTDTVRRVGADGQIFRVAGSGERGFSGDGGPARDARLNGVHGMAMLPDGGFVLADTGNDRIRRVWPDGTITTIAGTGRGGFSGDGGPAVDAQITAPRGIATTPDGSVLFPDTNNRRIRRIWPDGTITTVAGTGVAGSGGDGGPATAAQLELPFGVAPLRDGGFLVADAAADNVRRVLPDGTITTVAGTGDPGFSGDGGPATAAELRSPHSVVGLPDGGFLIADTFNSRVRRVSPGGTITTMAGTGVPGFGGDGGPAELAQLNLPKALAVLPDAAGFLIGDAENNRVRLVRVNLRPPLDLRVTTPRVRSKAGRPATIRYTLSDAAKVRLDVLKAGKLVLSAGSRAVGGRNRIAFGRSLRPGSYRLRLVAATSDGRSARASGSLKIVR